MEDLTDEQISVLLAQAEKRLGLSSPESRYSPIPQPIGKGRDAEVPRQPEAKFSVRDPRQQLGKSQLKDTAGADWFGLPQTELTPEFKRDWQVLRMRGMLDPKHHKKALSAKPPKFSQVGEIVASHLDTRASKLTRKEKKQTLLEETLSTQNIEKLQTKFSGIVKQKASGKKAFYDRLVAQRRKGR